MSITLLSVAFQRGIYTEIGERTCNGITKVNSELVKLRSGRNGIGYVKRNTKNCVVG